MQQQPEKVWAAFRGDRKGKQDVWWVFALLFTDTRLIFGQYNVQLFTDSMVQAEAQSQAQNHDQITRLITSVMATSELAKRYYQVPVDQAIQELGGVMAIPYQDIRSLSFSVSKESTLFVPAVYRVLGPELKKRLPPEYRLTIDARAFKETVRIVDWPAQEVATLKQMFGDRLKA